jgi:protoporphyrinogen oxidase
LYLLLAKHMQRLRMYTLRGGIGALPERLAERVTIRRNVTIGSIQRNEGAFVVDGERFSHVVVAVRGDSVLKLRGMTELLSDVDRTFFEQSTYQRAVTLFVATERPADGGCYALSIPNVEKRTASTIAFHDFMDRSKTPAGAGLLAATGGGDDVTSDALLGDVVSIYAGRGGNSRFVRIFEWPAAMPKFPPGRFREIAEFNKRERAPGLLFCGDYLMGPFVESAIASGYRAAEAV